MSDVKVSVALCTFNGGRFLSAQLNSILRQTMLPDEIILCDDGSTDATLAIAEQFANRSAVSVRIHHNPAQLGSVANFQQAISLCTGDIILLCDQDDEWLPDRVLRSVQALMKGNVGYVFSDADLVGEDGQDLGMRLWEMVDFTMSDGENFNRGNVQPRLLMRQPFAAGATMAFRGDLKELFLPIPERIRPKFHHDRWIALALSMQGHHGYAIAEPLIKYRLHARQQIGLRGRKTPWGIWLRRLGRRLKPWRQRKLYKRILSSFEHSHPEEYRRQFG